jgi:hypothetical protein
MGLLEKVRKNYMGLLEKVRKNYLGLFCIKLIG